MKGFLKKAAKAAAFIPAAAMAVVDPSIMVNTAVAAGVKHASPIRNNAIPFLNLGLSTGMAYLKHGLSSGDWAGAIVPAIHTGIELAGGSTLLHQAIKIPVKRFTATAGMPGGRSI